VIGNNIEHLAHAERLEFAAESSVSLLAAQLRVHCLWVNNIVSMGASCCRTQVWRTVDVRNSKFLEVSRGFRCIVENELGM
jgi:hypothetical protein